MDNARLNQAATALRMLSLDMVEQAQSGHPGMPMGFADVMTTLLLDNHLRLDPKQLDWSNRDRLILSNGHGSALLYSMLHLIGTALSLDDLKAFRQLNSRTPGHPEWGHTPGVEATTGPLGQGLAMAVGMALAETILAKTFNRPNFPIVDHRTYVCVGDGCLMEGLSHEASALAGTAKLGKLIVLYDDNGISIDGPIQSWFTESVPDRFAAYGWQVIGPVPGHDCQAIDQALSQAECFSDRPTLICFKTVIGYGSPRYAGQARMHGAPLGPEETEATRQALGWHHPPFHMPEHLYRVWDQTAQGKARRSAWDALFKAYSQSYPDLAKAYSDRMSGRLPEAWDEALQHLIHAPELSKPMATRTASNLCLSACTPALPELLGGTADLAESTAVLTKHTRRFDPSCSDGPIQQPPNLIHYGVREFAMAAILNGIALHRGFIPFGSTFLVFSDYARAAIRLSALMKQRVIYVLTHDSIGLGEDGPTHQPIEQLTSLRLIPNLSVWRPCDTEETAVAWRSAILNQEGPTALVLSRQSLPQYHHAHASEIAKGGYVLLSHDAPTFLLLATGSEVQLAVEAYHALEQKGCRARVVSLPCPTLFLKQDLAYQHAVLPPQVKRRIAIEAGSRLYFYPWVGPEGHVLGCDEFGMSAPGHVVYKTMGFTLDNLMHLIFSGDQHDH